MRPFVLALLLFPAAAAAEPPAPYVTFAFPAGGQAGTTVEVTVTGMNVQNTTGIRAAGTGIAAKLAGAAVLPPPAVQNSATLAVNSTATFALEIAPDAPPGLHELQLIGPGGASNRFRFQVGRLPEVREAEPNSTRLQAQTLPALPIVVNGQCLEGDRDFYRFAVKAGQTIVCIADARSLLPYIADAVPGWNDVCLTLSDAGGREIRTVDDFRYHPDPVLVFRAPADGEVVLQIRDVLLRGRADFVYRLRIGELPLVTDIFPLGGRRGGTTAVRLRGVNLHEDRADIRLPDDAPAVNPFVLEQDGMAADAVLFEASDLPSVLEAESDDTPAAAMRLSPPVVVDGRIDAPGDADHFVFSAKAGDAFVLEVRARRIGSPLDSILTLFNAKGQKVAENDDFPDPEQGLLTHQADSKILFKAPAAGEWVVRIRDLQGKGGPEYAYRLSVAAPCPDFALRVTPDNPHAARGDCALLTVAAVRKDGFAGPIQIDVAALPAGFAASPAVIPSGQDRCSLTVAVPRDAPLGLVFPEIAGTAEIAGRPVTRKAQAAEELIQSFVLKHLVASQDLALAVLDSGPCLLALAPPPEVPLEIPPGGHVDLVVRVDREGIQNTPVQLRAAAPMGPLVLAGTLIPADKSEGVVTISAGEKATVGSIQNVILTAAVRAGKDLITRTLPAIPVRIAAPPQAK